MNENKNKQQKTVLKKPDNPNVITMKKGDRTIQVNKGKKHVDIMSANGWKKA